MPDVPMPAADASGYADALALVAERLAGASHVVVLTGAGVSAESGLPTFRDALTGRWANERPEALATEEGFRRDPEYVQAWYRSRLREATHFAPNAGHTALVALAARVPRLTVVTQNVDGFHQKAGSSGVLELHGNLTGGRCIDCHAPAPLDGGDEAIRCAACGGYVRPDVVWFVEALPEDVLADAFAAAASCDVLLSVGTKGAVYPAASLPGLAQRSGAFVAEINPEPSDLADDMDVCLAGPSGTVLPDLLREIEKWMRGKVEE